MYILKDECWQIAIPIFLFHIRLCTFAFMKTIAENKVESTVWRPRVTNFLHNLSLDFPVEDFTYENDIYRVCERNVHEIVGAGKRVKTLHLF